MKKSERTRNKIMDHAAVLFADQGYASTSVRKIADAAEVNVAAISMYFAGKEGLYQALLDDGISELVERRRKALSAYEASGRHDLADLVATFVQPLYDMQRQGNERHAAFLGMLSRTLFEPDPAFKSSASKLADGLINEFVQAIGTCAPQLKPTQIRQRLGFAVGAISQALADPNRKQGPSSRRELLLFLTGAFTG